MFWMLLLISAMSTLPALWLRWRYKHKKLLAAAHTFPGPPAIPGLGNALLFVVQPEELITVIRQLMTQYGRVFRFWLGPELNIVVSDPDEIKILLSNPKTSTKGPQYKYMADVLGGGILSGSGPTWRKHRKIATPNYGKRAIESYGDIFNDEVDMLLDKIRPLANGQQFDIYTYVVQTTSISVCRTLMGLSREETINLPNFQKIIKRSPRIYDIVFDRMTKWYHQIDPLFCLSNSYREQKNFIKYITEFAERIEEHTLKRLKSICENSKKDLMDPEDDTLSNTQLCVIDRFILSQELQGNELLQEIFTIFTSSQEASAKISSFILLMMAYHPKCQEKLHTEIMKVIGNEDRPITESDLKQMPYLDMVFKEVLRLYPIGAMMQRTIKEDISTNSCTLPAGSSLVIPVYHLHRDPRYWERPDDFDPERFSSANTKLRSPTCYIPFSLGSMDCLGRYFGTKLIKMICVRIVREFELSSLSTYKDLRLSIAISVSSLDGYHVILTPRS